MGTCQSGASWSEYDLTFGMIPFVDRHITAVASGNQVEGEAGEPVVPKALTPPNADRLCASLSSSTSSEQCEDTNRWSNFANSMEKALMVHWHLATVENGRRSVDREAGESEGPRDA